MSASVDILCDNCGQWSSFHPDNVKWINSAGGAVPDGWIALVLPNCKLHLCKACRDVALDALSKTVSPCVNWRRPLGLQWKERSLRISRKDIGEITFEHGSEDPSLYPVLTCKAGEFTSDLIGADVFFRKGSNSQKSKVVSVMDQQTLRLAPVHTFSIMGSVQFEVRTPIEAIDVPQK